MPASAFTVEALLEAVDKRCTGDGVRQLLMVHRATAWRGLQRAEVEGLVERAPIPDGDAWLLTPRGRRALAAHRRKRARLEAETAATLARPGVVVALREALGPPRVMRRPRGRPRVDGTYQVRLPLDEPTNDEEAWWQGGGAWDGAKPSSRPSASHDREQDDEPKPDPGLGPLFERCP